jgi:methylase of polypeptide subunit release factors
VISSVSERFEIAAATDVISMEQAGLARAPRVDLVLADRASCFREGSFELVFFNPPYVPSPTIEDRTVDGGPSGTEVPTSFLEEAVRVLRSDGGAIFVLLSDEDDLQLFAARCSAMGLGIAEKVAEKKLFYETLIVFRLAKKGGASGKAKAGSRKVPKR